MLKKVPQRRCSEATDSGEAAVKKAL
jgi:hypothetical protein